MTKPSVFISYSHKDEEWKNRLQPHLQTLEQQGQIVIWDDRKIDTGEDWYPAIKQELDKAAVAICLISADYLASKFINEDEIPYLKERRMRDGMLLLPVLVRPCPWKTVLWLKSIQMFPRDGKSLAEIRGKVNQEKALSKIAELVYEKINNPAFQVAAPEPKWPAPKKVDIDRLPQTGMELFGRQKELKLLDEMWDSGAANVISFVAWGGVGKSTLVNKWLHTMKPENYRGAKRVYGWSFYSQGTRERVTSADKFISEALMWFGDPDPTKGSPWDKGQRLADLVRKEKTLLILDGLEPLQSAHDFEKGKIKDPALSMLINQLARNNKGLCVITTREKVPELERFEKRTLQPNLDQISKQAGRALLRAGGVQGNDAELEAASEQFGNHALAINLLASYIHGIEGHHIKNASKITDLDIPEEKGRHPRRVIAAYEERFGEGPRTQLLNILGLFDRPTELAAIEVVCANPPIKGLTDQLQGLSETQWNELFGELREQKLIARKSKHSPNELDCHPLVREHFGEKLQKQNPDAWKEAHRRLYEYYKNMPEKEFPDTLEEMEPLFAAVMHGCLAGKYQEAIEDIYYSRIQRDGKTNYCCRKLGALGADLTCLSNFFETLWDQPASGLREDTKAKILHWVGYRLVGVGRLSEAVQPMKTANESLIQLKDWLNAAGNASNISELYLALGDVSSAQKYGKQCVTLADRSGNSDWIYLSRITLADALYKAGNNKVAQDLFIEAENMQKKRQPECPWLYSLQGFKFCDLLVSMGKFQEVLERAHTTVKYEMEGWYSPLSVSSDKLTIGKALMLRAVETSALFKSSILEAPVLDLDKAENYLNQAVDGLREAGMQDYIPLGLLARASLFRHKEDFLESWGDLDEAKEIAEYGQMRLNITDYHLEACRNIKAQLSAKDYQIIEDGQTLSLTKEQMQAKFAEHFKEAERLVNETGYHRRDAEVEELRGGI